MNHATGELQRGQTAPDFNLPGIDGRHWSGAQAAGPKGLVVMFICNHCPYVRAVVKRIVREAQALRSIGVAAVAINSNDARSHPEDSFEQMQGFARRYAFDFPYLHDESQAVARAYGAQCTPEFFGFDAARELHYHGRLGASRSHVAPADSPSELLLAMTQLVNTGTAPAEQHPSIGCSIKWKRA